jgi:hypothetical protein
MSALPQISGWQAGFLQVLPAVQTHAKIQFRKLPLVHREEAIQEAVAFACVNYRLLATSRKLDVATPATLATYAVNRVRCGRHVGGRQEGARDLLSPRCHKRHRVQVQSIQCPASDWKDVVIADRKASIPDLAAFRIDFACWLSMLAERDRRIIDAFIAGEQGYAVADRFGLSAGRISQLRRRYERDWRVFQGEALRESRRAA